MKDYKRILQGVVNIINITKKSDIGFSNICAYIGENCPELKESEDERIRKRIYNYINVTLDDNESEEKEKWLAWLEKQGNKKDNLSVDFVLGYLGIKPAYKDGNAWSILLGDNIQEGICGFGGTKEEALIAFIKELIEERDKKSADKLKVSDELYEHIRNTCACIDDALSTNSLVDMTDYVSMADHSAKSAFDMIEKQGEKKPTDKVEPKYIKRGERKPNPYSGTSFEYNGHIWGMCARDNGVKILFDGKLKAYLSLEKSIIYPIHSQPELEAIDNIDDKEYCCILKKQDKSGLEVIKEEKTDNANKVEPKFNVGNTIRHKEQGFTCKITAIDTATAEYRLSECSGTHLPFDFQDAWELVEQKPADKIEPIFDVEIPFGAKDSELVEVFYSIPNGFHAEIKDDKVVIKKGDKKPAQSDEHYELEEFAKIVRCNLTGISKAVQKLFESKYIQLTGKEMYGGLKD